jgi:hypothetical protein
MFSTVSFSQHKASDEKANINDLIVDLHKNHWGGAELVG